MIFRVDFLSCSIAEFIYFSSDFFHVCVASLGLSKYKMSSVNSDTFTPFDLAAFYLFFLLNCSCEALPVPC